VDTDALVKYSLRAGFGTQSTYKTKGKVFVDFAFPSPHNGCGVGLRQRLLADATMFRNHRLNATRRNWLTSTTSPISVINKDIADKVETMLAKSKHRPTVTVRRDWYY